MARLGERARGRRLALALALALAFALAAGLAVGLGSTRSSSDSSGAASNPHASGSLLPSAALAPVSAALGAADPSYLLRAARGEIDGVNRAQRLDLGFAPSGVRIDSRAVALELSLRAAGYGGTLRAAGGARLRAVGNRALYERQGFEESYVNGPLGLEQGFTVKHPLSTRTAGALTLAVGISGNVHASIATGGRSVVLQGAHGASLRYDALRASDARGHLLPARFQLERGTILLEVDTAGARYPIRIDPLIQGEALPHGSESEESLFGYSVALSADGNTALVGGRRASGAAWVFTRSGTNWTQQGPPIAVEEAESSEPCATEIGECEFGRRVALSADGNTALIGGPADDGNRGAVWVFTRSGSTWTQSAKLTGGSQESAEGRFGRSLALSADGETALISATKAHSSRGAVWVFTSSGSAWAQQGAVLTGGEEEVGLAHFGSSVALSESADTALVGARMDNGGAGAVWVFTRAAGSWAQQGPKLTGAEEENGAGRFGSSVALSAFGDTALIGGRTDAGGRGAAWVFTRSGSTWSEQGPKLTGAEELGEGEFGASAALSASGDVALLGGPLDNQVGAAWLFTRSGSAWQQQGTKITSPQADSPQQFGTSVALSLTGQTAIVGGPAHRHEQGGAWVFQNTSVPPPAVASVSPGSGSSQGGALVRITGSGFLPGSTVEIGGAASSVQVLSETELTALTPAHAPGSEEVIVDTPSGESTGGPSYSYVLTAKPTVSGISPASGSSSGGEFVAIEGSGFLSGSTTVEIGSAASSVQVLSETELTALTSTHAPGSEEVIVSTTNGSSKGGPSYTYILTAAPTVSSISPVSGPSEGGVLVTIFGTGFLPGSTTVDIGGVASPVDVLSETELTAVTPTHTPGSEEVLVSTTNGETKTGPSYAYLPGPTVASITPGSGSTAGGTLVTLLGSGFTAGAKVNIGGAASSVEVLSETELTALTPAHAAGSVEVSVTDSDGVSSGGPAYAFAAPGVALSLTGIPPAGLTVLSSQSSQLPPPQLGVVGNLVPISGTVLVKLPGSNTFTSLSLARQVPFGTVVNADQGTVTLTTLGPHDQLQAMAFYEGEFQITQRHSGRVFATLRGGDFAACPTKRERAHSASARAASAGKHTVRKLWASGHGSYSTKGNYAAGAVLGTRWLTEDFCNGTYIHVATDSVEVTNLVTHRQFRVTAGHSYFAPAP